MSSVQFRFNYLLGPMCSVFSLVVILWYQGLGTIFQKIDPPEATRTTSPRLMFLEVHLFQKNYPPEATCTTTSKLVFLGVHFSKNRPAGGNLYNAARACVKKVPVLKK